MRGAAQLLVAALLFGASATAWADPPSETVDDILCRGQSAVGFSYAWGGECWCATGCSPDFGSCDAGSCSGSCPSCTHYGTYGADCSGFVSRAWQVPRALAEAGRLDMFFTDVYATPLIQQLATLLPPPWDEKLRRRHDSALPSQRIECLWGTTLREWIRHGMGQSPAQTYATLDVQYAEAAARRARESRSNLLLYTPYAWEAFTATYSHSPRRVLFQYHPHAAAERRVLREDAARFSEFDFDVDQRVETGAMLTDAQQRRVEEVWRHADLILCASSFTRQTVVEVGAVEGDCAVIPYGVDFPDLARDALTVPDAFRVLFVGTGVQRKGLHHLLYAWRRADLPEESSLTLVCRSIDSPLRALASDVTGVKLRRGVSFDTLVELYRTSTLFAMPSLIEGFGQVYLEAMSQGCPVLGTPHTCLPDVGTEREGVYSTPSGDVDALTSKLEQLSTTLPGNDTVRKGVWERAATFTWSRFRRRVTEVV